MERASNIVAMCKSANPHVRSLACIKADEILILLTAAYAGTLNLGNGQGRSGGG